MLLDYPMPTSSGFNGYLANIGDMRNTGIEAELTVAPIRTGDFRWDITWMGSTVSNKVLHLTKESPEIEMVDAGRNSSIPSTILVFVAVR